MRDPLIPNDIRGSMATLMVNIHVRKHPHSILNLPRSVRRYERSNWYCDVHAARCTLGLGV
jgi:hypothetical protein